jgi:HflK protein
MVAAIGGLARRGILVRGGKVLEAAAKADTIVFDKTGTVTEGRFEVLAVVSLDGGKEEAVLGLAAAAEAGSDHMLARVIVAEARHRKVAIPAVESARILPGRGAEARRGGKVIRVGNAAFLGEHGISGASALEEEADRFGATVVLVAEDEHLWGGILLRDRVRAGVKQATKALKELGLTRQVMLTGDRRRAAEVMAREAGISEVEAELLPEEKLERVQRLRREGRLVAMVGDGVNDAPALAAAQVGIAVSGASDITAEAADVVYMGRSLEQLPQLFAVSRRAVATAWQNIIGFALIVNVVAIGLASSGKMGPLGAAFTHQIASFLVMLNSLRLLGGERAAGGWRAKAEAAWRRGKWWWERQAPLEWLEEQWEERRRYYRGALYAVVAAVVLNGFYVLEPEETGVIERFGRKQAPLQEPGLHYKLPWPVERLWRVETRRVRVVEVGFRTESKEEAGREPLAYEWNAQHRTGRFARRPEESLMLSGDQNLTELTATVHYRIARPEEYLFEHVDAEATLRAATEATIQEVVTTTALDDALTGKRREMEGRIAAGLQARAERYRTGVEILAVRLLDVHPPVEVVDAYREVSGAYEEKSRLINEAEGYRNEQVALARGRAAARRLGAEGYRLGRVNRAAGEAARFREAEGAYRMGAATTELRLYLETMEEVLPGKQKMIVDSTGGRRHLLLNEDSVEVAPLVAPRNEERKR